MIGMDLRDEQSEATALFGQAKWFKVNPTGLKSENDPIISLNCSCDFSGVGRNRNIQKFKNHHKRSRQYDA
jgi:hypothetical protein